MRSEETTKTKKVEEQVADTLLETKREVTIGGKRYEVAPPSFATLIAVSGLVARVDFEALERDAGREGASVTALAIHYAPYGMIIGSVIATLVLGVKRASRKLHWYEKLWMWLRGKGRYINDEVTTKGSREEAELIQTLLVSVTPSEMAELLTTLLEGMELGAFFGLTTFLRELNVAKPTREVA